MHVLPCALQMLTTITTGAYAAWACGRARSQLARSSVSGGRVFSRASQSQLRSRRWGKPTSQRPAVSENVSAPFSPGGSSFQRPAASWQGGQRARFGLTAETLRSVWGEHWSSTGVETVENDSRHVHMAECLLTDRHINQHVRKRIVGDHKGCRHH
jgi:hypothetical protein